MNELDTIERAAKAAQLEDEICWYHADALLEFGLEHCASAMIASLPPSAVLELVRLARIGEQTLDRLDKQTERANITPSKVRGGIDDY